MRGKGPAESALLRLRVQPRASRDEVVGWDGSTLRIRVSAPPLEGQANQAVLALLARNLRVPISAVMLVRGAHGRDKVVRIQGCSAGALEARLKADLL